MTSTITPAVRRAATWTAAAALALSPLALTTTSYAAPAKAGSYTVTAKINKTVAIGNETTLKVRGRVTPKAAGQKVVLQQRVGKKKKWKATGSAKIKRNGTYVLKDDPSTPGKRKYRVLKPGSNGIAKGFSKALDVQVYAWQRLAWRSRGAAANITTLASNTIGTKRYPATLQVDTAGTPAYVEYTLGRQCLSLRATYALTDRSETGSTGQVTTTIDGRQALVRTLAVGTVEEITTDLTDAFRLRFDLTSTAAPAGYAAVATPKVLCTR